MRFCLRLIRNKELEGWLYALPYLLFWGTFIAWPVGYGIYLSLFDWNPIRGSRYAGLANYIALFNDGRFLNSLANTFKFAAMVVPFTLVVALAFALLLWCWHGSKKFANLAQAVFFFPYLLTVSVIAITWKWFFDPDFGVVTAVCKTLHLTCPKFLADPVWALPIIALATIWWLSGYRMIVFQAALGDIPQELFEVAKIDGVPFRQQLTRIILPLIKPPLLFSLVLTVISAFRTFGQVLMMTEGGPGRASEVLALYLYWNAFEYFRIGRAAAAGVVLLALTLVLTLLAVRLLGLKSELQ